MTKLNLAKIAWLICLVHLAKERAQWAARRPSLDELPNERFRSMVNSAEPVILDSRDRDDCVDQNIRVMTIRHPFVSGIELKNVVEVSVREQKWQTNKDIPDNLPLQDMGVSGPTSREFLWPQVDDDSKPYRKTPWLDSRAMDDRDFRERCIVANNRLYVLYPMGAPELAPANHLRAETLQKWFAQKCGCAPSKKCQHLQSEVDYADCDSLVKVFDKLGIDRRRTLQLMFGYQSIAGRKHGLKSLEPELIAEIAADWEMLEAGLEKLAPVGENAPRSIDDEREYFLDVSYRLLDAGVGYLKDYNLDLRKPFDQMRYIEMMASRLHASEDLADPRDVETIIEYGFEIDDEEIESDDQAYEDADFSAVGDGWTAFPLSDGNDTVDYHWTVCIRTAGVKRLWAWKRLMGKLWWLTYAQRSDLWNRINERQAQLIELIKPKTAPIKAILNELPHLTVGQAKALIYSYQVGGSFARYTNFEFDEPGDPELVFYLWDLYKKM